MECCWSKFHCWLLLLIFSWKQQRSLMMTGFLNPPAVSDDCSVEQQVKSSGRILNENEWIFESNYAIVLLLKSQHREESILNFLSIVFHFTHQWTWMDLDIVCSRSRFIYKAGNPNLYDDQNSNLFFIIKDRTLRVKPIQAPWLDLRITDKNLIMIIVGQYTHWSDHMTFHFLKKILIGIELASTLLELIL